MLIDILKYNVVDSTNETAKKLCADHHKQFVVTAKKQTAGKGQYGRDWLSPAGENFLATFCVPQSDISEDNLVSFAVANAVSMVLKNYGFTPQCKWPNDIEISGGKIAGILTEKVNDWFLIGIGLNLNWPKKNSKLENGRKITSLFAEAGEKFNADEFVSPIGKALNLQIKKSAADILKIYKSFWNKKRNIEILVDDKWLPAKQTGIDSYGTLITKSTSGKIIKINTSARIRINDIQNSKS